MSQRNDPGPACRVPALGFAQRAIRARGALRLHGHSRVSSRINLTLQATSLLQALIQRVCNPKPADEVQRTCQAFGAAIAKHQGQMPGAFAYDDGILCDGFDPQSNGTRPTGPSRHSSRIDALSATPLHRGAM